MPTNSQPASNVKAPEVRIIVRLIVPRCEPEKAEALRQALKAAIASFTNPQLEMTITDPLNFPMTR